MKKSKLFYLLGIVLVSTALVFSSCKKDDDPVPAPPADPVPGFTATYIKFIDEYGIDRLYFLFECTTDNVEIIKIIIDGPLGEGGEFYGLGLHMAVGEVFELSTSFLSLVGDWNVTIQGDFESGEHNGKAFVWSKTLTVSKK